MENMISKPKQVTLEEAVIGLTQLLKDDPEFFIQEQDKNKYTEEKVLELLLKCPNPYLTDDEIKQWFQQFKNK